MCEIFGQSVGDLVIGVRVPADNLQIDGRGQSEIDNLAGDIGWLKEEIHVGKLLAQSFPQKNFVVARRPMFVLVQRNQDFAIRGGNGREYRLAQ